MAKIPQHFIDQVLDRTDIVSLIGRRVSLKRAGTEYVALCPFHDEKTPSFTVAPKKQFYYCFGCGATGSAIGFAMDYDRLEFREAIELLAADAGLELPAESEDTDDSAPARAPLFESMAFADRHYKNALRRQPHVIEYLKKRGVTGEIAQRFGLGFAPDGGNDLASQVPDPATAAQVGLLIERERGGYFDRFRNRLMFPIRDGRGRIVAFGGRALGDDKAKYLNSPETPLFHKSNHMYGLYEARQALREIPRLLVVEGYMDVIALAQHGFDNAVATLGTATTESHLKLMFRHTEEVVFCFDGDTAGQRAADKALDRCLPVLQGTRRVRFLFLPADEDPDTLVRRENGISILETAIEKARSAADVLIERLLDGVNLDETDGPAQLVERGRPYVSALPNAPFKTALVRKLAELTRLPIDYVQASYTDNREHSSDSTRRTADSDRQTGTIETSTLTRALTRLLADPELAAGVCDHTALNASAARGAGILVDAIDFFQNNPNLSVAAWLERQRGQRYFDRLQQIAAMDVPGSRDQRAAEFVDSIARLRAADDDHVNTQRSRYHALLARQSTQPLSTDEARELNELARALRSQSR